MQRQDDRILSYIQLHDLELIYRQKGTRMCPYENKKNMLPPYRTTAAVYVQRRARKKRYDRIIICVLL